MATKRATFSVSIDLPANKKDESYNFIKSLELNLEDIASKSSFLIILLGDFNARMQSWYQNGLTTFEGCKIDMVNSQFSLSQIIKEPTHILSNSVSYIDLIFTSQPNLIMHFRVHPSLHPNRHHQTVFAKFNVIIFCPPPCKQLAWHYQQGNTDFTKRVIELFDWEKSLSNLGVNNWVSVFNKTITNIFKNFILHETITCNDKNNPWMETN